MYNLKDTIFQEQQVVVFCLFVFLHHEGLTRNFHLLLENYKQSHRQINIFGFRPLLDTKFYIYFQNVTVTFFFCNPC